MKDKAQNLKSNEKPQKITSFLWGHKYICIYKVNKKSINLHFVLTTKKSEICDTNSCQNNNHYHIWNFNILVHCSMMDFSTACRSASFFILSWQRLKYTWCSNHKLRPRGKPSSNPTTDNKDLCIVLSIHRGGNRVGSLTRKMIIKFKPKQW